MTVEKLSISFDERLAAEVRAACEHDDASLSAWLAEAARQRLRNVALGAALDDIIAELGYSEAELLDEARRAHEEAVIVRPRTRRAR